jgi:hypothetical protein
MTDIRKLFGAVACWVVLFGYAALVAWGVNAAFGGTQPTGGWFDNFGTGVAAFVAAVVAAAVGQQALNLSARTPGGRDGPTVIIIAYAGVYLLAGIASIIACLAHWVAAPTLIRTIATSVIGLLIGAATAYLKPKALFG